MPNYLQDSYKFALWFIKECCPYVLAWGAPFGATYFRDSHNPNRPRFFKRLLWSLMASYLGYLWYDDVSGITVHLYVVDVHIFKKVWAFIMFMSYFSIAIFKEADKVNEVGFRTYIFEIWKKRLKAEIKEKE
jgi:hypothetical protein